MIKRNRCTALMLAAAAVVSIMPVKAYASSDKVKSIKGEIYNAIAYKDGKSYIAGKPKSKDDAAYYFDGKNYKELKDINSDEKVEVYGEKYVKVDDGEYFVDLSSGEKSEKKIEEKDKDSIAVDLRSEIKSNNDGRYDNADAKEVKDIKKIPGAKYAESWYASEYKAKEEKSEVNGGASKFTVYCGKNGKYIDADYNIGRFKVKLSNNKTADLKNTNSEDEKTRVSISDSKAIGQDSNNIYRLAKITIKTAEGGATIESVNGLKVKNEDENHKASSVFSVSNNGATVSFEVIQVISKSQASGNIDGIKYSRSVTSYILCDKEGKKISLLNDDENGFTVANGKLINYKIDGSTLEAEVVELKSKSSLYYVERGHNDDTKLQNAEGCVDIDSEGNLWALTDGYVRKFDNDEDFEKVYEIEDDYENMSVYDKNNIILWNDKEYAIIGEKTANTSAEDVDQNNNNTDNNANTNTSNVDANINVNTNNNTNTNIPANNANVTLGWVKNAQGQWIYNDSNGSSHKGWLNDNGVWYYLDSTTGIMSTGWYKDTDGKWYYLQSSGAMKTGWFQDSDGKWYYFDGSGAMLFNTTVGIYRLGADGAWVK